MPTEDNRRPLRTRMHAQPRHSAMTPAAETRTTATAGSRAGLLTFVTCVSDEAAVHAQTGSCGHGSPFPLARLCRCAGGVARARESLGSVAASETRLPRCAPWARTHCQTWGRWKKRVLRMRRSQRALPCDSATAVRVEVGGVVHACVYLRDARCCAAVARTERHNCKH